MATENNDILLNDDGSFKIENGDFAIGDGTLDDCNIIIKANTGTIKLDPILGPNIIRMTNSNTSPTQMKQEIKLHLNRDNKFPKKLDITNGFINIDM
jgi:hypothetical protein